MCNYLPCFMSSAALQWSDDETTTTVTVSTLGISQLYDPLVLHETRIAPCL